MGNNCVACEFYVAVGDFQTASDISHPDVYSSEGQEENGLKIMLFSPKPQNKEARQNKYGLNHGPPFINHSDEIFANQLAKGGLQ